MDMYFLLGLLMVGILIWMGENWSVFIDYFVVIWERFELVGDDYWLVNWYVCIIIEDMFWGVDVFMLGMFLMFSWLCVYLVVLDDCLFLFIIFVCMFGIYVVGCV